jgi:Tfp pilus assembly ATPase PilU
MQTMEQALAELVQRSVVTLDDALTRSSRPEQLLGLLERVGFDVSSHTGNPETAPVAGTLRVAGA